MPATPSLTDRTPISYGRSDDFERDFRAAIAELIDAGARRICDVGGGAKPFVGLPKIQERGLDYLVLDESREQLERAPDGYARLQASILDRPAIAQLTSERGAFDAVISCWVAEHVRDGQVFHEQVFELLRPGGTAVHLFPTLYSLPFVLNRVLTPTMSAWALFGVCSDRKAKFRPYYSWCRGPSDGQVRRLEAIGFKVRSYTGYFGHSFYAKVRPLHRAHQRVAELLVRHPMRSMTSFAVLVLERPG